MGPSTRRAHPPSNYFELLCVRTTFEVCVFHSLCAELTGVTAPFHARDENTLDCGGTTPLLFRAWLAPAALEFGAASALPTAQVKRGHVPAVQSAGTAQRAVPTIHCSSIRFRLRQAMTDAP